jgi:hypothetical protein
MIRRGLEVNVRIALVKGKREQVLYKDGLLHLSTKTAGWVDQFPMLLSDRSKNLYICRQNMVMNSPNTDHFAEFEKVFHQGRGHTLTLSGFTPDGVHDFLGHITRKGALGHTISRLVLYMKGETSVSYGLRLNAMVNVCTFITQWCTNLRHLSIVKLSSRKNAADKIWTSQGEYVREALNLVDNEVEELINDLPVHHELETLFIDYPELDTNHFFHILMRFDQLRSLTLKRIHPVFSRRDLVIRTLLWRNQETLRSVDIDFGVDHYQLDATISDGLQELLLTPDVVSNGLRLRVTDPLMLKQIKVRTVGVEATQENEIDLNTAEFIMMYDELM